MKIYIDGDACPVTRIAERAAKEYAVPVVLLCDTNHVLNSDYSEIRMIGAGADAVDIVLIDLCQKVDIVVTQDYGVAALALGKGAKALHQSGRWYTGVTVRLGLTDESAEILWNPVKEEVAAEGIDLDSLLMVAYIGIGKSG